MKNKPSYSRGMQALKANNIDLAESIFKDLIKEDHNNLKARFALARLYAKKNKLYKARSMLNQIVENTSSRIKLCIDRGKKYIDKDDFEQASNLLENANKLLVPNMFAREFLKKLYDPKDEKDKIKILLEEQAILTDLEFRSQFDVGNIRGKVYSKKEAKEYLDNYLAPHLKHILKPLNYSDLIKNNFESMELTATSSNTQYIQPTLDEATTKPKAQNTRKNCYPEELNTANRLNYFISKNPSRIYKGLNKFKRHVIFEYPELGICILEKLYKRTKDKKIKDSYANATYILPMGVIFECSDFTINDLRALAKTDPSTKRIIHNETSYYEQLDKALEDSQKANLKHKDYDDLNSKQYKDIKNDIEDVSFDELYDDREPF